MLNNCYNKYANVMQQINSSSCGLFTIPYATNITFEIDPKNPSIFYHKCDYIFKTINIFLLSQNTQTKTLTSESCNGYPYPWVNGWVMGMGLDAWVGNGWVRGTWALQRLSSRL
jgi:hypothetical protein